MAKGKNKKQTAAVEEPTVVETVEEPVAKEEFDFNKSLDDIKISFILKQGFKEYIEAKEIKIKTKDDLKKIVEEFLKHNLEVK